ncbi:MAG TPA: HEPN domain-containing protein [Candidatus Wallbacteria bacterium]|nr:HEPN domain-containing protein [Candidatus Wallbacteria bacterium]
MSITTEEWFKQSDYDIDTAQYMFDGGRYFYSVFMCHLAIEKALKGLFQKVTQKIPEKTHSLVYLVKEMGITPPEEIGKFIVKLSTASVVVRYPEDTLKLQKEFNKTVVNDFLEKSREAFDAHGGANVAGARDGEEATNG